MHTFASFRNILKVAICVVLLSFSYAFADPVEPAPAEPESYTILYDLNGGQLPSGAGEYPTESSGNEIIVDNPIRSGYVFAGWVSCAESDYNSATNTCSNGTTITAQSGSNYTRWGLPSGELTGNIVYIAQWNRIITITWTGVANPGNAGTCEFSGTLSVPATTPTTGCNTSICGNNCENCQFIGWKPVISVEEPQNGN